MNRMRQFFFSAKISQLTPIFNLPDPLTIIKESEREKEKNQNISTDLCYSEIILYNFFFPIHWLPQI